jgi:hypothetical protein
MIYEKLEILENGNVMVQKTSTSLLNFVLCPFKKGDACNSNCVYFNELTKNIDSWTMIKCNSNEQSFNNYKDWRLYSVDQSAI